MNLALFDLDHTLLPMDSDYAWGEFTISLGWHDATAFQQRNDRFFEQYRLGTLNIAEYVFFATEAIREHGRLKSEAAHVRFMQEVIVPGIRPEALALVESHRRRGDHLLIVTATNEFVTGPIASAFGVETLLAVDLQRDAGGWFTGEIRGVPSFREGKVTRLEQWLAQQGLRRSDVHATFYSDSLNDLPLLDWADEPVATNPDEKLRAVATARGWRILDLFEPAS